MAELIQYTKWNIQEIKYSLFEGVTRVYVKRLGSQGEALLAEFESYKPFLETDDTSIIQMGSIDLDVSIRPLEDEADTYFKLWYLETLRDSVHDELKNHVNCIFNYRKKVQLQVSTDYEPDSLPTFIDVKDIFMAKKLKQNI